MALTVFRRPPRREPPPMPVGAVELHSPPAVPEKVKSGAGDWLMALPMLGGVGSMAFMFAGSGGRSTNMASSVMFGMSSLGMGAAQLGRMGGGERRKRLTAERRDYMRHLSQVRRRARSASVEQREALRWLHPEPFGLLSLAATDRLWERRPFDPDFGTVRLGRGSQQLALELQLPETQPMEDVEPLSAAALRRFTRVNGVVPDLPVAVAIRSFARILLEGPLPARRELMRGIIAQAITWHAPTELVIALCVDAEGAREWDWLKWVPHLQHPTRADSSGPVRYVNDDLDELEDLLADDLAGRPWFGRDNEPLVDRPHVIVIVDGGKPSDEGQLSNGGLQGVTVFDLSRSLPAAPELQSIRLRTDGEDVVAVEVDRIGQEILTPVAEQDRMSRVEALELARVVAPMRMPLDGDDDQPLSVATGLTDLLGVSDARTIDPAVTWRPRPQRERLRVAIGVGSNGAPVELDIKEAAQGGMGPHGLLIGATGSGKSELLRTLVLGLAMTHSPEILNFILVDFKGGATFTRLDELPHTSAVITNLAEELTLVDRMQDAISGEVNRRQELLRTAGNYASLRDYDAARASGAELEPLPTLFVVVDEFSELLSAKPDFIDLFVMIGRVGRSLGVHLLLASQRLEEGKLRGLDTYLSYRIGLKTFSAAESRVVLGVPDAYELPTSPGNGYLKYDTDSMTRFKAAYVSGPYKVGQAAGVVDRSSLTWSKYELWSERADDEGEASSGAVAPATGQVPSVMDVVLGRLRDHGTEAHRVWLPPLDEPASLDSLIPGLEDTEEQGFTSPHSRLRGRLAAPAGLVDLPYEQRREQLLLDFSGAAGHGAIVGGPQSGKSTLLRSIISSLALLNTPEEVQFYCLDFGGGSLTGLASLPHVGVVANRLQQDLVNRTVNQVAGLLDRREASFVTAGVDSIATWRRQVRSGELSGDGYGDVFLVLDGMGVLRDKYEDLEPVITSIASRGLNFGVHVLIAASRWAEVRPALRDLMATRLELRLGDATDSEINSKKAALVPAGHPGRGLTQQGEQFISAVPRIDAQNSADELTGPVAALVSAVSNGWHGQPASPVKLLPMQLSYTDLAAQVDRPDPTADGKGVLIGLDEDYEPLFWNPEAEQHLVVFGDGETGKTSLLRSIMVGLTETTTPEHAQFLVVDPRRDLLETVAPEWISATAIVGNEAASMVAGAVKAIQNRVPGADITPAQLRARSWWSGPHMYLVIDDLELVAATGLLGELGPVLPYSNDIGLHVLMTRTARGASRALYDAGVVAIRDTGAPFLVLDAPPDEGTLVGTRRVANLPPGRGRWVSRSRGEFLVQLAERQIGADLGSDS